MLREIVVLIFTALLSICNHVYVGLTSDIARSTEPVPLLCYYVLREPIPKYDVLPPDLNPDLCSHLIFLGSTLDHKCRITFKSPGDGPKFAELVSLLRLKNPKIKLVMCNGGGDDHKFEVISSDAKRLSFAESIVPFLKKYDLDGIDLDWEFPGWPGPRDARKNFTLQIGLIRTQLDQAYNITGIKYTLSAAVAAGRSLMEIYDIPTLGRLLDFINLMCYDYNHYGTFNPLTDYNSPLYPKDWDKQIVITSGNVGWSSYEWVKRGMPAEKIMVGIPTYAVTWTLEKPDRYHGHLAPAIGHGRTCEECTYPWVCQMLQNGSTRVYDEDAAVPYTYQGDQWVSYDDRQSFKAKANWIIDNKFGGIMVYDMNDDDYNNTCKEGIFPLITTLREVIHSKTVGR